MTSKVLLRGVVLGTLLFVFTSTSQAGSCGPSTGASASAASSSPDIVDTAVAAGSFETLVAAVQAAGLVDVLKGDGPFTVFAPTDDAFAALPDGTVESLLEPENRQKLVDILTYHVVPGRVSADDAFQVREAATVQGDAVSFAFRDGAARVNDARLVQTDIETSNGVIHVIDGVLLPDAPARTSSAGERVIERAIATGAPLFNDGNPVACAAVYVTAAEALLAFDGVSEESGALLERALRRAGRTRDASDQAWIMRGALDEVYAALGAQRMASSD